MSTLSISRSTARRFLLAYQGLWPPRQQQGARGVLDFIRRVGCIQFDPIDIVGRNPDLVLQSRVRDYRPALLDDLLYTSRRLLDGWDKQAAIYLREDWPYFAPYRRARRERYFQSGNIVPQVAEHILRRIRAEGALSSLDFKNSPKTDWHWGPTSAARAGLEGLYAVGALGIRKRVRSRRYFDLTERLLSADLLAAPEPHADQDAYHDWHVLRRVGSMGLAAPNAGEHWLGIVGAKSAQRRKVLKRLVQRKVLVPLHVEGVPAWMFYLRTADLPLLERIRTQPPLEAQAAFIAPLDNLLWNRKMVQALFDFAYVWEVYKPKAKRRYGYYTLPVLYGEHFVARADFSLEKKPRRLRLNGWWWQPGVDVHTHMRAAVQAALDDFSAYLQAAPVDFSEEVL